MEGLTPFRTYDLLVSLVVGLELVYILYVESELAGYRRPLLVTVSGLVLFVVGGSVTEVVSPNLLHWIHGLAALLVVLGLYSPVNNDLRTEEWARLVLHEPSQIRQPADWMTPMDDSILELFHSSELVLTPAIIALNIDHSREEVNRRLGKLDDHGLVEKVDRGKYQMTGLGERYLRGELHVTLLTEG